MARPTKFRRVCSFPDVFEFYPIKETCGDSVVLTVDEFETVRLIDYEGLSQAECGKQLGVGRTTVQKIYGTARRKLAEAIVFGAPLKITGGDFRLCNGSAEGCYKKDCFKRQIRRQDQFKKGADMTRIAVAYENGEIYQHFGHSEHFKVYDVEDGKIVNSKIVDTNGSGHGALAGILSALKADVLICGGIGGGAQAALSESGIKLFGGVCGNADEAVNAYIAGHLEFVPDVHCERHDHAHGGKAHGCGEGGCGHCGNG